MRFLGVRCKLSFVEFLRKTVRSEKGFWALGDQALLSLSNFALMFLAARFLVPFDFGLFSLLYSLLLLGLNIQAGILLDPLVVLLPRYSNEDAQGYVSSAIWQQLLLSVVLVCLVFLGFWGQELLPIGEESFDSVTAVALAYGLFFYQVHEFFRRLLFQAVLIKAIFVTDTVGHLVRFGFLVSLLQQDQLNISNLLFLIGHGFLVSALLQGLVAFRKFEWGFKLKLWAWSDNWQQGRWLLSTNLLVWGVAHAYLFILAKLLGAEEAGALRAVQTLFGPLTMMLLAADNLGAVLAARRYKAQGPKGLAAFMKHFVWLLLGVGAPYCFVMMLFGDELLGLFYRQQYRGLFVAIVFVGCTQIVGLIGRAPGIGLRVLLVPGKVFRAYVISGLVVLVTAYPLVEAFQINGATFGTLISSLATVFVLALVYFQTIKKKIKADKYKYSVNL